MPQPESHLKPIVRQPLLTASLPGLGPVDRVEVKRIEFEPLQKTGLHYHPCPVVGYIASGTVRFQIEGQEPRTLNAGDAFHEPANTRILHFDNASDREPMSFIAFYLLGADQHELICMLEE
jgi:quercetin dioxygenase-like cupin family protein